MRYALPYSLPCVKISALNVLNFSLHTLLKSPCWAVLGGFVSLFGHFLRILSCPNNRSSNYPHYNDIMSNITSNMSRQVEYNNALFQSRSSIVVASCIGAPPARAQSLLRKLAIDRKVTVCK